MGLTHCYVLLEVFLATNKMRDLWGNIRCKGTSIDMDPFSHLFGRALFSEIATDRNGEALEWLFPQCHCGPAGLEMISLLHH